MITQAVGGNVAHAKFRAVKSLDFSHSGPRLVSVKKKSSRDGVNVFDDVLVKGLDASGDRRRQGMASLVSQVCVNGRQGSFVIVTPLAPSVKRPHLHQHVYVLIRVIRFEHTRIQRVKDRRHPEQMPRGKVADPPQPRSLTTPR